MPSVLYLSKRAAYHLREVLEFSDKALVMHGLRHNFTSACERAGIPLSTAVTPDSLELPT